MLYNLSHSLRKWIRETHSNTPLNRKLASKKEPRVLPSLDLLEDRLVPASFFANGADAGSAPEVRLFDAQTGQEQRRFLAFSPGFLGGVRVGVTDINHDNVPDIIAAAGPGGGPHVKIFNGRDLSLMASFFAYSPSFTGGVNVAGGDITRDGFGDVVTGPGSGGGPNVKVFNFVTGKPTQVPGEAGSFMAYDPAFRGGVSVATGNVDGLPGDEIVTGPGKGGGPNVKVFDHDAALLKSFRAYDAGFQGGVFVATGDFNHDNLADVVTGPGIGGGPEVRILNGQNGALLKNFLAYGANFSGGVRIATADANGDSASDIITGPGKWGGPHAKVFDGLTYHAITEVSTFENNFTNGVFGAAGNYDAGMDNSPLVDLQTPILSRLARFVPNSDVPYIPQVKDWVTVGSNDANIMGNVYVIAHGFAPGFEAMVASNSQPGNPLKWWQTLDTTLPNSPGAPASPEMFLPSEGAGVQISPTGLAKAIMNADPNAVVLAYSWIDESAYAHYWDDYKSEAYTHMNGVRLARALEMALPTNFHDQAGTLHIIGHSHGSKVATVATDTLEESGNANFAVDHLSILDSPEDASNLVFYSNASNNLWYFLGALNIGRSASSTFVDNYISYFDTPLGPMQGFDPLNTSIKKPALQQLVDVNLNPGVLYDTLGVNTNPGESHAYAFNWFAGAGQKWSQNLTPESVLGGQSVFSTDPTNLAGSYTQTWSDKTDPQYDLTPAPQSSPTFNTQTKTSTFTDLSFSSWSAVDGASYDNSAVTLTESGTSTPTFSGKFVPVGGVFQGTTFSGISFNYQFTNPGAGDQLVISVDTGFGGVFQLYYIMTGTVADTAVQFATLSLGSLSIASNATVKIQLVPASGSAGAAVTVSNLQQFTSPK